MSKERKKVSIPKIGAILEAGCWLLVAAAMATLWILVIMFGMCVINRIR